PPAGDFDGDAIAFGAKAGHARAGAQLDRALLPAAAEQRAVDIGAVRHRVRIAEALREARVERDVDHRLAADPVHHQQVLDEDGLLLHSLADAERIDGVPGVRRELDAGADLAELGRLLEHDDPEVAPRQGERDGKAADTASGDDYGLRVARRSHRGSLSIMSSARRASGERASASVSMTSKWFMPLPMCAGARSFSANSLDWRANSALSFSAQATVTGQRMRSVCRIGLYS